MTDKIKSDYSKSKTLTDLIYRWWSDVFTTHSDWDMETSIEDLVDQIQLWLQKEQCICTTLTQPHPDCDK